MCMISMMLQLSAVEWSGQAWPVLWVSVIDLSRMFIFKTYTELTANLWSKLAKS